MSNIRKLSAFRQLSLNCNSDHRRRPLKKQFSEDLPDIRDAWLDTDAALKISLSSKSDRRPSPIKIAWEDNAELKTEEAVIIKKCREVRRASTGKLSRQSSLDKDSILHSKQEIADKLRHQDKEKEQEKTNLKIFLAHNSVEQKETYFNGAIERETPKLIQPLINAKTNGKNLFQINRNRQKIEYHESAYSPTRPNEATSRNNTVVVIPIVDSPHQKEEIKPIDSVIIRPTTAALKRQKFQKRSNSAFSGPVRESRPTLARSSSALARPEHGKSKFVATKRKIRSAKRSQAKKEGGEGVAGGGRVNEDNPAAANGADIVTMVSLVSPAGSEGEGEEESTQEGKEKCKSNKASAAKEEREAPRSLSLRRTVKSVSFQQSSIHAVRSFSASFPARRASMATAITLGGGAPKTATQPATAKVQEKRSTNPSAVDDDERVPKRRLLRSQTEDCSIVSDTPEDTTSSSQLTDDDEKPPDNVNITVDIKSKEAVEPVPPPSESGDGAVGAPAPEKAGEIPNEPETPGQPKAEAPKYDSPKERQCWELYRKMTERGINVSLDTILRGMLTPTEYRLSRQNSVVAAAAVEETDVDATVDAPVN